MTKTNSENEELINTNIKIQKNYDNANNQLLLHQNNLDVLMKQTNYIKEIKKVININNEQLNI